MYRLLLDTNVLIDAVVSSRPENSAAKELLVWCNGSGDMAMVSATSLKDVYYILTKTYDEPTAREAIHSLMDLVVVAPVSVEECEISFRSGEPDFEDGIIWACAELNGANFIISRDQAAFRTCPIRSVSASEYMEVIAKQPVILK